ncbi:MAG: undecaprenyl-diphosphate phosphatase [Microcoleus sp. PH2017_29_MFU_D_A]|uniref:undecaprenyl-diphosphate phosphatase n=1 Tax=unclassified Microcoleus TaxID=2642155 RepID=UPI001D63A39C|nr:MULTISPECIES: undecaprenyl-diphosphate phosphatase [unclassified Microcoleus]MCC3418419.1 undecaprenyl-diphosphate phosphatase [Microcoleus sp. PH2017_07_MST_O_A]MCC3465998.1 undecaprenyl-diphosphate phosphatase [Microcoleus sp. PH2017_06_SFM_O_A]MCC3512167.1 undecaprenyl-diphosphate phosphatase [Microcoleus sp. PH2017_17_BER_D_A]TAE57727.1 MAG: undecaprenyl-diphosphate phosphatase [Oscillatoriales cyanobacterium]MCC3410484.1 undecaprenyl-diphosphate phosphatase [Microcoleus sp. PH2017_02_F
MIALLHLFAQTPVAEASGPAQINILQAIVLGIVQGLTEFLPISSSAHLKVVPLALGWADPGVAYTAVIQLGSIVAVLWYFWKDLTNIAIGGFKAIRRSDYESQEFRMALGIGLGTIPIIFFGLLIKILVPDFDKSPLRSLGAIAIASIVMSLLLAIAEKTGKRERDYEKLDIKDGILMGLAQAMAIIPGVSRSGSTLTAGLFLGLQRAAAARFSFLLGIPAITLAGLVELKSALGEGASDAGVVALIVGTISAFIFSYISIAWLMKFLQTQNTWVFVWYRLAFGVAILTALAGGVLQNPQG